MHAYRRDIADVELAGRLFAPHYARPLIRSCGSRPAFLRPAASSDADPTSELLPGEGFAILDISGHWAWGYCVADHYVGFVEAIELVDRIDPTHLVAAVRAPIYAEPDEHTPVLACLPMGSRVSGHERAGFLATESGFIPFTHVRPIDAVEHDPVAVAERLIDVPYLLGGRSVEGIDCSGLVQLSLALCGIACPRDSDQQRALGNPASIGAQRGRGDIVFFEGHVGFLADELNLIHATGHHGKVVVEPLADVQIRTEIVDVRRL